LKHGPLQEMKGCFKENDFSMVIKKEMAFWSNVWH